MFALNKIVRVRTEHQYNAYFITLKNALKKKEKVLRNNVL